MMTKNQQIIAQQEELIHRLSWNAGFGCYNRNGFEHMKWPEIAPDARWIVYFDVDGVHALNEQHGSYEPFNAMMKQVLASVRSTDIVAGQFNSGDEFVICILEKPDLAEGDRRHVIDPHKVVGRLTEELARHGLTATFAVSRVRSSHLLENVQPAADQVLAIKKQRGGSR